MHAFPSGGMELDDLLAVAVPLAEGLAVAHDKGIEHRDLKPANVVVTRVSGIYRTSSPTACSTGSAKRDSRDWTS